MQDPRLENGRSSVYKRRKQTIGEGGRTPRPSYWGETETKEWRRKLREEKEKVERKRWERTEWRVRETQMRGYPRDHGRPSRPPGNPPGWIPETRTPYPYWRENPRQIFNTDLTMYWPRPWNLVGGEPL